MCLNKRLKILLTELEINQTKLGDKLGVKKQNISSIINGRSKLTLDNLIVLKNAYPRVNVEWLLFGIGNPLIENLTIVNDEKAKYELKKETVDVLKSQIKVLEEEIVHQRKQIDFLTKLLSQKSKK